MPKVYRPDHTAHIRQRLKDMALKFAMGIAMAAVGAVTIPVVTSGLGQQNHTLVTVVWLADIVLFFVAELGLAVTGVLYLVYRRRRADLDAAGTEAIGELYARLHRPDNGARG